MAPGAGIAMRAEATLRISADLGNLAAIRQFIREKAATFQDDDNDLEPILQAVDESVTNVVVHGYRGQPGAIEIEVRLAENSLAIRLRDQAPPFDPTAVPSPDVTSPLEKRPVGGLGVYLTRRLVDEMIYRPMPQGGNELTLVKRIVKPRGNQA